METSRHGVVEDADLERNESKKQSKKSKNSKRENKQARKATWQPKLPVLLL